MLEKYKESALKSQKSPLKALKHHFALCCLTFIAQQTGSKDAGLMS